MRFINKKRTRKDWVGITVPERKRHIVEQWCRRHEYHKSGWYRDYSKFYFQDPSVASEIILRFL